jgi:hypothetical protein
MQATSQRNIVKTQHRERAAGVRNEVQTMAARALLLDRDRQPGDQPRHLVQSFGIVILDGPCKTGEAFVVAHRWHIAWHD